MNITEFARLGGKARWKGLSKKQRSEAMKKVRKSGIKVIHKQALDDKQALD